MSNFKRGRRKQSVRCCLCTDVRWMGNHKGRFKTKDELAEKRFKKGKE